MERLIEEIKTLILDKTNPTSIFLYGSYNTSDYLAGTSDLEIGVLREKEKDVTNKTLRHIAEKYSTGDIRIRIYSYDINGLKNGYLKTPFTKSVFIRRTILTAKTIWGEKIIENLPLPSITLLDAYREACFTTMRALSSLFSLRAGNLIEAKEMTYKACLFATLSLEFLNGNFPIGFQDIVKASITLKLTSEQENIVQQAYQLRKGKLRLSKEDMYDLVFDIINYCSQTVELRIKKELEKKGDIIVVE